MAQSLVAEGELTGQVIYHNLIVTHFLMNTNDLCT